MTYWYVCPKCKNGHLSQCAPRTMTERVAYRLSGLDPMTEEQYRLCCTLRGIEVDAD